jgi:hypothetical protein
VDEFYEYITQTINKLKCCGNCLNYDFQNNEKTNRGQCLYANKFIDVPGCYVCKYWEFDHISNRKHFKF